VVEWERNGGEKWDSKEIVGSLNGWLKDSE